MIWQDVVIFDKLTSEQIIRCLAGALTLDDDQIRICYNIEDFPESNNAIVVCVVTEHMHGFRLTLSLYVYSELYRDDLNFHGFVRRFARLSQTDCLVANSSPDPYLMTLIYPSGDSCEVSINIEFIDNDNEYHVVDYVKR